jgi:hypothetical protein
MEKRTRKFIASVVENLPELYRTVEQNWIDNPDQLREFLSGLNRHKVPSAHEEQKES